MPIPQLIHKRGDEEIRSYSHPGNEKIKKNKNNPKRKWLQPKIIISLLVLAVLIMVGGFFYLSKGLPDPNKLIDRQVAQSTKIYDRKGETVLYEIYGDQKRTMVSLSDIPMNVRNATIAIEDKGFYKHGAFSLWAIFRTVVMNVVKHQKAGGSTLTQQLVKNAILTNEKSYVRKLKEIILAYQLEQKFSKDEVLQMYLNEIPYGSTAYGVEAASQRYFGKSVKDTSLAEAAILAALPQAPSRYSPYGPNRDLLIQRQRYILDLMAEQKYITQDEAEAAKKSEVAFSKPKENIIAPHFVMYLKEYLSDMFGEKTVEQGGLKIISTIDLDKQKFAEAAITEKAEKNAEKYNATNAALVSIDPRNGQILAMVGSKDYFSDTIDGQVNIATSPRQPGSSFKPIVYAASFIKGFTPNTILYDVITNFSTDPNNKYEPHNYDNNEHGPVTIRKALAGSLNIPAVKAIYLTGIKNVISLANKLGYSTLTNPDRYGLSLVLGGGEVQLLEHTNAYSAFSQDGVVHTISPVLKVEDKTGKAVLEFKQEDKKAFDAQVARQITSILSDNNARSYVFGTKNYLTLPDRPVAAKTGTTNDYKDAWTVGYTPSIVTGVWVGNNDATSMKRGADGSVVAAPIWNAYMKQALSGSQVEQFTAPAPDFTGKAVLDGAATTSEIVKIDKASGLLATDLTPASYIIEKNFGQPHNILYYVNKEDPRGPAPKNPNSDPQFALWEAPVQAWAKKRNLVSTGTAPTEKDNLHTQENLPSFSIETPQEGQSLSSPTLNVVLSGVTAPRGVSRAEYFLNDNLLATVLDQPFNLEKNISFINGGYQALTVKICDDIDNCTTQKVNFNFSNSTPSTASTISIPSLPSDGLVNAPINILFDAMPPASFSTIKLLAQLGTSTSVLKTFQGPETTPLEYIWTPTKPGAYKIFAEGKDWSGKTIQSNEPSVLIK